MCIPRGSTISLGNISYFTASTKDKIMGIFSSSTDFGGYAGRKRLNAYNVWMLVFVSLGSVSYGYTASIIGTTLGRLTNLRLKSREVNRLTGQPSFLEYFALTTRPTAPNS